MCLFALEGSHPGGVNMRGLTICAQVQNSEPVGILRSVLLPSWSQCDQGQGCPRARRYPAVRLARNALSTANRWCVSWRCHLLARTATLARQHVLAGGSVTNARPIPTCVCASGYPDTGPLVLCQRRGGRMRGVRRRRQPLRGARHDARLPARRRCSGRHGCRGSLGSPGGRDPTLPLYAPTLAPPSACPACFRSPCLPSGQPSAAV